MLAVVFISDLFLHFFNNKIKLTTRSVESLAGCAADFSLFF